MGRDDVETEHRQRGPRTDRDPRARPCLQILAGGPVGELVVLAEGTSTLGRGAKVQVQLDDNGVSREHAKLVVTEDLVNLVDLDSTNGTFVNGAPVDAAIVRDGDRIHLGPDVSLLFAYLDPDAAPAPPAPKPAPTEPVPLSPRELQVARLVAEGLTNPEIGRRLFISPRTVTTHLVKIYGRLDLHSRAALTRYVLEQGLLLDADG